MTMNEEPDPDKNPAKPLREEPGDNPGEILPNPDDPNEQIGPPMREMPIINGPHHEEILDHRPDEAKPLQPNRKNNQLNKTSRPS